MKRIILCDGIPEGIRRSLGAHSTASGASAYLKLSGTMTRTREQIEWENNRLKAEYGELFDSVADILFQHDPVGINFEDNTDEYYPEVRTILPRLKDCHSAQDVTTVVHEEFVRWFEPETAGPKDHYQLPSEEIWKRWQEAVVNRRK